MAKRTSSKQSNPRPRSAERTRSQLIESALVQFARHGLQGTSVGDIARDAGVTPAMINHHFGGKLELYRACIEGFGELRLKAIDKHLVVPASVEEFRVRLEILVSELFDVHVQHRDVVNILLRDLSVADQWGPGIEKLLYEFTPKFAEFFELAKKGGVLREDVSSLAPATMIYLTLSGLLQADDHRTRVTGLSLVDADHRAVIVKMLIDVVLNGVSVRPNSAQP